MQSLVADLLLPAIGLAITGTWQPGNMENSSSSNSLKTLPETHPRAIQDRLFGVGPFLVALITFIIVAFVIFLIVKVAKKWGME